MFQNIINFVVAHEVVLAGVGVAVLDLVFALNPSSQSNGILHWVFVFLTGKQAPPSA